MSWNIATTAVQVRLDANGLPLTYQVTIAAGQTSSGVVTPAPSTSTTATS